MAAINGMHAAEAINPGTRRANGVRSACGAHWPSSPDRSVPVPSPPRFAKTATKLARRRRPAGARSITYAVAVPVKIPADRPETTRPT